MSRFDAATPIPRGRGGLIAMRWGAGVRGTAARRHGRESCQSRHKRGFEPPRAGIVFFAASSEVANRFTAVPGEKCLKTVCR